MGGENGHGQVAHHLESGNCWPIGKGRGGGKPLFGSMGGGGKVLEEGGTNRKLGRVCQWAWLVGEKHINETIGGHEGGVF